MPWCKLFFIIQWTILLHSPVCFAGESSRIPDNAYFDSYRKDKDYQYGGTYKPPASESIFQRIWRYVLNMVNIGFEALRLLPLFFKIFLILSCLIIIYVIATKTKLYKMFYADPRIAAPDYVVIDPLDEQYNFDSAIALELSRHNHRNAIRLLHLKILKELELNEIIRLSKNKTNREYTREIPEGKMREAFIGLTGIYNRIWYGKYPLSDSEYNSLAPGFQQFTDSIYGGKK